MLKHRVSDVAGELLTSSTCLLLVQGSHVLVKYLVDPESLQSQGLDWASHHIRSQASKALQLCTWLDIKYILKAAEISNTPDKAPCKVLLEPYVIEEILKEDKSHLARPLNEAARITGQHPILPHSLLVRLSCQHAMVFSQ